MSTILDTVESVQQDWIVEMKNKQLEEEQRPNAFKEEVKDPVLKSFIEAYEEAVKEDPIKTPEDDYLSPATITDCGCGTISFTNSTNNYVIYPSDSNYIVMEDGTLSSAINQPALETLEEEVIEALEELLADAPVMVVMVAPLCLTKEPESLDSRLGSLSQLISK